MNIGGGSPWVGVLFATPFGLLMLWITLVLLARVGRGLAAALGVASPPAGKRGRAGLVGGLLRDIVATALFACVTLLSFAVAFAALLNYAPDVGNAHPLLTRMVDLMVDAPQTQRELERGLRTGHRSLVELALAIGADPGNRGETTSLLATTADPALRRLLIEHGAPVDGLPAQTPPLRSAVMNHDLALFEQLLRAGARRGLQPVPGHPRHLLEWMSESGYGVEWLEVAIAAGIDMNAPGYGGASLYDRLSLNAPGGDWWQRLNAVGLRHRLALDRPQALPPEHPGIRHVLAWLKAQGSGIDVADHPDWELPGARPDDATWIDVPHTGPEVLAAYGSRDDLLVRVRGSGFGGAPATVVVRVMTLEIEPGGVATDADPSASSPPRQWRVAAAWSDARAP